MKNKKKSLTLIEMMMVTAMLAVISLAIYTTFSNGIKIWQRMQTRILEEDLNIVLDKFCRDLRNTLKSKSIGFSGLEESIGFSTLVNSQQLEKLTIGKVEYYYDSGSGTFNRRVSDYSQIFNNEVDERIESIESIEDLSFQYYVYKADENKYVWLEESMEIPLAVRVDLELNNGSRTIKFTKTVSIPVSG